MEDAQLICYLTQSQIEIASFYVLCSNDLHIHTLVYIRRKWETCITQFSLSLHSRQLSFSLSFLQAICPSSGQTRNVSCGCWSRNEFELLTGSSAVSRTNWLFADSQCVVTHSEDKIWHVQGPGVMQSSQTSGCLVIQSVTTSAIPWLRGKESHCLRSIWLMTRWN